MDLVQERKDQYGSQQNLADEIGTEQYRISLYENRKSIPSPHYQRKLCDALDCSMDELMDWFANSED